jgi:hypothetical protein
LNLQIRKSQKIYGPQIENPQIASFAEGPQIKKKNLSLQICGFAN